jgi:hypothetical protein
MNTGQVELESMAQRSYCFGLRPLLAGLCNGSDSECAVLRIANPSFVSQSTDGGGTERCNRIAKQNAPIRWRFASCDQQFG